MSDPDAPALSAKEMISALSGYDVVYIVIGGIAAAAHGSNRVTRDLDIIPQWQPGNLDRLANALTAMGARLRVEGEAPASRNIVDFPISGQSLASFEVSAWRTRYGDIDIILGAPTLSGVLADYDALLSRARFIHLYGFSVLVAHLEDIIESKRALRREPDMAALPELHRILEHQRRNSGSDSEE